MFRVAVGGRLWRSLGVVWDGGVCRYDLILGMVSMRVRTSCSILKKIEWYIPLKRYHE